MAVDDWTGIEEGDTQELLESTVCSSTSLHFLEYQAHVLLRAPIGLRFTQRPPSVLYRLL